MPCIDPMLTDESFLNQFNQKVYNQRIPISGNIELTKRCNFKCQHCYFNDHDRQSKIDELDKEQWFDFIDQIVDIGCLSLLITGGDPLIRKDFSDIYSYARKKGLLITVFTNGTLINLEHIDLFKQYPPNMIEITLYGSNEEKYNILTGSRNNYNRLINNLTLFKENNIKFRLKAMLMSINEDDFSQIRGLADKFDVKFRFDPIIVPKKDGSSEPLDFRLSPERVIAQELSDKKLINSYKKQIKKQKEKSIHSSQRVYQCGMGRVTFHIDSHGKFTPCIMADHFSFDLLNNSFKEIWNSKELKQILEKKHKSPMECYDCEKLNICAFCPAMFRLENGTEEIKSEYVCKITNLRFNYLK